MIHKCIALFNLLPTSQPHFWLIAADWLEEENKYTEANTFRESLSFLNENKNGCTGGGYGSGGFGSGDGSGDGVTKYGWGLGSGGYGSGGYGSGGFGSGDGDGNGCG